MGRTVFKSNQGNGGRPPKGKGRAAEGRGEHRHGVIRVKRRKEHNLGTRRRQTRRTCWFGKNCRWSRCPFSHSEWNQSCWSPQSRRPQRAQREEGRKERREEKPREEAEQEWRRARSRWREGRRRPGGGGGHAGAETPGGGAPAGSRYGTTGQPLLNRRHVGGMSKKQAPKQAAASATCAQHTPHFKYVRKCPNLFRPAGYTG